MDAQVIDLVRVGDRLTVCFERFIAIMNSILATLAMIVVLLISVHAQTQRNARRNEPPVDCDANPIPHRCGVIAGRSYTARRF